MRGGISDIRRHNEHGDTTFRQGCLARRHCLAPSLVRRDDHLAIDAAALEHVIVIDLLDRIEPEVLPYDLGCDQDDRGAVTVSFIQAVDEMETARAACSRACREPTGKQRFGRCGEGAGLFMTHVDPIDLAAIDGVSDPVQGISDNSVACLHAGCLQRFHQ